MKHINKTSGNESLIQLSVSKPDSAYKMVPQPEAGIFVSAPACLLFLRTGRI